MKENSQKLTQKIEYLTTKPEDVQRCTGYEHLSPEQAVIVAVSLKLFSEILMEAYMLTGKAK